MHGCNSPSVPLVNAEVESMGGVVEGGVGIAHKTSPRRAAIERIQGELRQEYNVRDKTKRELEFLEKGGNPLDLLKPGDATSVSVQSTSFTNQHQDHFVTSEAKGSFAFTASPHGDSVESSGRLGANPCEPNSADNLMLFDGEHECSEGDKISLHPSRSKIVLPEKLSQMDGSHRTREHGESAAFSVPRKAYKRRNRSRPNRDGIRLSSVDVNTTHGSDGSSLPSRHGKELKGQISDAENRNISINCDSKPICAKDGGKTGPVETKQDMELGDGKAVESSKNLLECVHVEAASDAIASEIRLDDQCNQQSHSGALETPIQMTFDGSEAIQTTEEMSSAVNECQHIESANKIDNNESSSCQINGISSEKDGTKYDAHNTTDMKVLDSASSCALTNKSIDGNNDGDMCKKITNADVNGLIKDQTLPSNGTPFVESDELVIEKRHTRDVGGCALDNPESSSACLMQQENGFKQKHDEELNDSGSAMKSEVKNQIVNEVMEPFEPRGLESGIKTDPALNDNLGPRNEIPCAVKNQNSIDTSTSDFPNGGSLTKNSTISLEAQTSSCSNSKLQPEIDEDSILKEAQIIEAKRKRIAQLSAMTSVRKIRPKSHWDYVLEEMAWLANDFAQERVWKIAAAAQISSRAAFACRLRKHENNSGMEAKKVAHTLAKSIMEFWHSVEAKTILPEQESQKDDTLPVKAYAVRFLKHNNFNLIDNQAEVPPTPDRVSDTGILDLSWEDNLTEENLFYAVPAGAMETYKLSIVSQFAPCENLGNTVQEEVETSACDATEDFESQDTAYDEGEGDISPYSMPMAFDKSSRFGQKKRKHFIHAYGVRSYDVSSDILPMQYAENKVANQPTALMVKRPGGSLNVSIPTKRVRTASRRVISPFSAGTSGCIQVPNKTDASSGDTNSFQDDQSTLHGGSFVPNSLEVESGADFNKHLPFHSAEIVTKHKKKKKPKHLNASYEPRWQVDTTFQIEQFHRDNLKRSHQLESNGNSGLFGQPMIKKPKIMRPSQDNSFENIAPGAGSAPSPATSQMSNMSNPNKFIKMLGGRDRGRKPKILKMPTGQLGSGSPWTLFEDQALVVLAHDLGPNWELVSDAINSTLQFKCIFRKAKECKERHNYLMDRTSGDGADSAEDSGSSQPYSSTLPGIPKGSARQLFQRLQGPMEEETLKSHFEKIIIIGQKQQYRKNQDPKQLQQPHGSHTVALSQVCPNNLNGGPVLTPLDICDAPITGPDILPIGYQGPHTGGLAIANQGPVTAMHPASGAGSALQGSPNMMLGNNFSSSPGSMRDARYVVPRPASADEQQRMQQYNHMMTNRNVPQPNLSPSGALPGADRGVRLLPGGNGMGLASGVNRSMPMARPGFQGIASPSMVTGSMVSPSISSANMHSGVGSGQGSSMLRPREPMHMMRPGLSQDSQRQMMAPELQMQASPGNSQAHFGGLSSAFPNQTVSPPVSSYPLHHQPTHPISPQPQVLGPHHPHFQGPPNHSPNPQQQAYAVRLAKERQHRLLQQQQQQQHPVQPQQPQFAASSSLMPHVQSQSPTVQNSSQVQPQTATPPVSLSPLASVPQHQQKHQVPGQGGVRNAQAGGSGLANQTGKQRQRQQQQLSQANRQHPQQRQQSQAQQPAKVAKGVGRGSLMMHQNIPVDHSLGNGVSTSPGNQSSDKGDASTHLMSSQGSFANSALNTVQPTGQYASPRPPNQSLTQQKNYPGQAASSTKHLYQMPSQPDSSSQGNVPAVPSALSGSNHQQTLSHQKLVNQNQSTLQRLQPNRQINSDPAKSQAVNSDADQRPTSSSTDMVATTTLPQTTSNTTNVAKVVSSANAHQPTLDGHATNMSRTVSMPANAVESATQVGQELGQRPLATMPSNKHDVSAHFQQQHQQSSQLPHPNSPVSQQPLHSQQGQLLQTGKGNLYGRPGDHSVMIVLFMSGWHTLTHQCTVKLALVVL
ncbi:chromatin modification-related protein EAF1 B-like isoform X1 [Salvia miltiorrhiza]|uniref:chromatin modification-related protein EAF1 B-like isoform X1 n=1 Tax=Salvia miltiorrhiza TaxID=226208 RepID=UPI0025AB6814|nr:chromatin modification-related protein EAF1 B-like isoform X1 [Salvia miltiorrhiza]